LRGKIFARKPFREAPPHRAFGAEAEQKNFLFLFKRKKWRAQNQKI